MSLEASLVKHYYDTTKLILSEIGGVLSKVDVDQVYALIDLILSAEKVFLIGVGRVMLCLNAFSKRLNHLGIRCHCVGDVNEPAITKRDLLIIGSGSGESVVPVSIANVAVRFTPKIAHIGSNPNSSLEPMTDLFVRIPSPTKLKLNGEMETRQPMTNLFDQALYIFCDVVTIIIIERKGLDMESLWQYHANLE
jgi:6-phospho-3-hexuloisomerase